MRVKDFMKKELITVDVHTPIMAALETMKHNKIKRLRKRLRAKDADTVASFCPSRRSRCFSSSSGSR